MEMGSVNVSRIRLLPFKGGERSEGAIRWGMGLVSMESNPIPSPPLEGEGEIRWRT